MKKIAMISHIASLISCFDQSYGTEVIKLFSCSTQLSMKLQLLINEEIAQININFRFISPKPVIYPADKC